MSKGMDTHLFYLIDARLSLAKRDYAAAASKLELFLTRKGDVDDEYHARLLESEIFATNNDYVSAINAMKQAKALKNNAATSRKAAALYARAAEAVPSQRLAYYKEAKSCFLEIQLSAGIGTPLGGLTFSDCVNFARLYRALEEYSKSLKLLQDLGDIYREDYRVDMELSFTYSEAEDHFNAQIYCEKAWNLYRQKGGSINTGDPDVLRLRDLYNYYLGVMP